MNLREFLRSHPAIIDGIKRLEHAGFDAGEDFALGLVAARLGILEHFIPTQTIADSLKAKAETFIDSKLDELEAPEAPAVPESASAQTDPRMRASQEKRRADLLKVQNPSAKPEPEADPNVANPPT